LLVNDGQDAFLKSVRRGMVAYLSAHSMLHLPMEGSRRSQG